MSTRSVICKETENKTYVGIYCHFDGYPEGVGKKLLDYYADRKKVEELLQLGDLSSLEKRIAPNHNESHSFDDPIDDVCVAYHRDRGEELRPASQIKLKNAAKMFGAEYMYVYMLDGTWYFANLRYDNPTLIPLTLDITNPSYNL